MRSEGEHVIDAMDEAFAIGRSADVPVVISHFKVHGKANFGRSAETLAKFEAQRLHQPLALDAYPYSAVVDRAQVAGDRRRAESDGDMVHAASGDDRAHAG